MLQVGKSTGDNPPVAERVLEVARELLRELGSQRAVKNLAPAASLERQLGLGSLERVELVSRLEVNFSVSLPDKTAAEAETLNDLIAAINDSSQKVPGGGRPERSQPAITSEPIPSEAWGAAEGAATLNEALVRKRQGFTGAFAYFPQE